jgi:hypothetical protein
MARLGKRKRSMHEKDFKDGVYYLKKLLCEQGLYNKTMNCKWIIPLSKLLSEYGVCKDFWYNTYLQGRLEKIRECETINDLFHYYKTYLFDWCSTEQGHSYWERIAMELMMKYGTYEKLNKLCKLIEQ